MNVTALELADWKRMYEAGATFAQLARRTRRDKKVIRTAFRLNGIPIRKTGPQGPWRVGWCDECCDEWPLNPVTGWCSDCSSLPSRPTWNHPSAARPRVECGPGSSHSPALGHLGSGGNP
jgi:hypothetical protein